MPLPNSRNTEAENSSANGSHVAAYSLTGPTSMRDPSAEHQVASTEIGPFPLASLPGPIRQFVEEGAAALPVPPDFLAIPALVASSGAIGNSYFLKVDNTWSNSACLYAAIVSDPGAMKSPALALATKPLKDLQKESIRTWTSDATVESLVSLLTKNSRGLLVSRDELSGWVNSMNQYKGGKGTDKEFYLSAWSGEDYLYDRAKDGGTSIILQRPFLSVVGGIPPDVLHSLVKSGGDADGFFPRILFGWPNPIPVRRSNRQISDETLSEYRNVIQQLYAIPYDHANGPRLLEFTLEAQEHFDCWHDFHMEQAEQPTLSPFLKGVYAKLKGYCVRLALIHALVTDANTGAANLKSLEAAIALVDYFKVQAHKVDFLFDYQQAGPLERVKAAIRRQLSVCRYMKRRELQRKMNCPADIFQQALDQMSKAEISLTGGLIQLNW